MDSLQPRMDFFIEAARGKLKGISVIHKFGANPAIGASSTEDIIYQGTFNWQTSATTMRIKAGNAADIDTSGAGARTVYVEGLDATWALANDTLVCNGTSAGSAGSTSFIRIFRAYVLTCGTYTGNNTGDVVIENSAGGTDYLTIAAGYGQTQSTGYTIPLGKTAYLTRVAATVDAAKAVDMEFWQRRDADDTSAPMSAKRLITKFPQLIGEAREKFDGYVSFPAKTDLWWTGTTGSGAAAAAEADYDLILVDD